MLSVAEALARIFAVAQSLPPEETPILPGTLGRVLAEKVLADRDSPPFTKSLMDGYAVRSADVASPGQVLQVVEEIAAGQVSQRSIQPGEAIRLFTGAPIPAGVDAVVKQEDTERLPDGQVKILCGPVRPGQFILPRGQEMRAGDEILPRGTVITPAVLGLLANVGCTRIAYHPIPQVGILATGNELVEANQQPGPGQIRNSNGPMLAGQVLRAGCTPRSMGIARDDAGDLTRCLRDALARNDVLLLAGGVSVGDYDLVPKTLTNLGVTTHFHQIRMKPGKPLLFGTLEKTLVFGLPGNPVSSYVGFELFVKPALRVLMGYADPGPATCQLPLAEDFQAEHDRPTYHPARCEWSQAGAQVRGLPWFGSPDLRGIRDANAFLVLPPGRTDAKAGTPMEVILV